jgi:hypothetical protein
VIVDYSVEAEVGVTQVVDQLLAGQNIGVPLCARQQARAASGSKMSCRSPRSVIVVNTEQAPFAANYEGLPIGPEHRSMATPPTPFGRDLT